MSSHNQESQTGQVLLYQTDEQGLRLECRFVDATPSQVDKDLELAIKRLPKK